LIDWYLWDSISSAIAFILVLVGSILLITRHSPKVSSSFILLGVLTPIIYDGLILIYYGFALHATDYELPLAFAAIKLILVLVGSILLIIGHSSLSYVALVFFATRVAEVYFTSGGYYIGVPVGLFLALIAGLTLLPPGRIEATKVKDGTRRHEKTSPSIDVLTKLFVGKPVQLTFLPTDLLPLDRPLKIGGYECRSYIGMGGFCSSSLRGDERWSWLCHKNADGYFPRDLFWKR